MLLPDEMLMLIGWAAGVGCSTLQEIYNNVKFGVHLRSKLVPQNQYIKIHKIFKAKSMFDRIHYMSYFILFSKVCTNSKYWTQMFATIKASTF